MESSNDRFEPQLAETSKRALFKGEAVWAGSVLTQVPTTTAQLIAAIAKHIKSVDKKPLQLNEPILKCQKCTQ